jgi:hypothetical protein
MKRFRGLAPTVTPEKIRVVTAVWMNKSPLHTVESYDRNGITFMAFVDPQGSTREGYNYMVRQGL